VGEEIPARSTPPSTRSDTVDYHTGSLPGAMTTCRRLEHFRFFGAGWGGSLIDTCQQLTGRGL